VLSVYLIFGPWLLELVYHDPVYRAGFPVLALLSVARLVHVFTGSAALALSMTGHQQTLLRITVVTSALTVLAAILAVGTHGAVGVAAAISAGVSAQALWVWLSARFRTGIWTHVTIPSIAETRELLRREP
jgi:O-antigen/teichoic acid export membrane protein